MIIFIYNEIWGPWIVLSDVLEWKRQVPEDSIRIGRHINMREAVEEILKEKLGSGPKNIRAGIIGWESTNIGKNENRPWGRNHDKCKLNRHEVGLEREGRGKKEEGALHTFRCKNLIPHKKKIYI